MSNTTHRSSAYGLENPELIALVKRQEIEQVFQSNLHAMKQEMNLNIDQKQQLNALVDLWR